MFSVGGGCDQSDLGGPGRSHGDGLGLACKRELHLSDRDRDVPRRWRPVCLRKANCEAK